jgi:hypothetical protein
LVNLFGKSPGNFQNPGLTLLKKILMLSLRGF